MNPITFQSLNRVSTPQGRLYILPDGKTRVPSVTNIIDVVSKGPALQNWIAAEERKFALETAEKTYTSLTGADGAGQFMGGPEFRKLVEQNIGKTKAHMRKLKEAADLGTAAHNEVERRVKEMMGQSVSGPQPMPEGAELVIMAFDDYCRAHDFRPIASEGSIFDKFQGFGGTFDIIALVDGMLTLIDIKSSKKVWRTQKLQLAAYQSCVSRHPALKGKPIRSMILRLPKTLDDIRIEPVIIKEAEHEVNWRAFLKARDLWFWLNEFEYSPPEHTSQQLPSSQRPFKPWLRKPAAGSSVSTSR